MNVQKKIKQLMEERNWTEYRLAKEANLSHSTVSNMFKRNNAPSLPTLECVCKAFGVSLSQFFAQEEEPVVLTGEQKILLKKWITLTDAKKKALLDLMNTMEE